MDGELEILKEFVKKNLNESGKWMSPNGVLQHFEGYMTYFLVGF